MNEPLQDFLLDVIAYGLVSAAGLLLCVAVVWVAPYFWRRPLPLPRLRPGAWGGVEVVFALMALPVAQRIVVGFLADATSARNGNASRGDVIRLLVESSPVWVALTLAVITTLLFAISRSRPHQYGVTWARWPANVILGVLGFVLMTPVVLLIYLLVVLAFGDDENAFEQLAKHGMEWWEWALFVFMTVVGAPLIEELTYRGVLLGWLRRASLVGHAVLMTVLLIIGALPGVLYLLANVEGDQQVALRELAPATPLQAAAPLCFSALIVGVYVAWMYGLWYAYLRDQGDVFRWRLDARPTMPLEISRGEEDESDDEELDPPASLPPETPMADALHERWAWANVQLAAFGSGSLFALAHGWPNAVPLLLLALGLGWFAYRTQSLVGCIVCHSLFNGVACVTLYLKYVWQA